MHCPAINPHDLSRSKDGDSGYPEHWIYRRQMPTRAGMVESGHSKIPSRVRGEWGCT